MSKTNPGGQVLTLEALEVLPPVARQAAPGALMPLAEIEDHIRQISDRIAEHNRGYQNAVIYDIVGKGLMLLKARASHQQEAAGRFKIGNKVAAKNGAETVSGPSDKQIAKLEEKGEEGFQAWFEKTYPGENIRTARNYMNAARNAGLTADHGLADVEKLREAMALHDKTAKELYRIKDEVKPTTPTNDAPVPGLVQILQLDLFDTLDQVVGARDAMEAEEFEATTTRIQATLEKLTGHRWVMSDEAVEDDAAQHGDQHAQPAPAQPKAKGGKRKK